MRTRYLVLAAACLLGGFVTAYVSPALADGDSNKWRIKCNHTANSDGEIVFRVHPKGAEPMDVKVQITTGTTENKVAKVISEAFKAQLPAAGYHVEVDDGEDVLVKKKHGAADFNLMLVSTTVENVDLKIKKE